MTFKPEKKILTSSQHFAAVSKQKNLTTEINLPDYCSDIKRILKCIITPWITSVSISGENIRADIAADVRLVYVGDKDKTDCFETHHELSVTASCKDMPAGAIISPTAKTNYVNCRATSQRRINVEGNISVCFDVYSAASREVLTGCEGMGVQINPEKTACEKLICQREKVFEMGETVQVPADKGAVGKILRTSAWGIIDSQKAVSDKLLIKGQLYTQVLYCVDGDDGRISLINHSMPISQIIDLPGIDENSQCNIKLGVRCLNVQRKSDADSKGSLLEIGAKVAALCVCSCKEEICTVTDCYSTSNEIKTDYTAEEFLSAVHSVNQQKTVKHTLEIASGDIANVTDIWCSEASATMTGKGDTAKGECSLTLCVLWLDSRGVPQYSEKNVDFPFDVRLKESYESLKCDMRCQVRNIDSTIVGKDKLEVKIESGISAEIYSCEHKRIVKNIEILEEKNRDDMAALTLYFPLKGEKLWDIARRYGTTAEAIKLENDIDGDAITEEKMILI